MLGSKFVLLGICGLQSSATFQESDFLSTPGVCNRSCALPIETNCVVVINISFKNICISITERLIPAWKPTTPCCGFGLLLKKKQHLYVLGKFILFVLQSNSCKAPLDRDSTHQSTTVQSRRRGGILGILDLKFLSSP